MTGKRRLNGDGSVYRSERGRGWVAQYEIPRDASGRRRRLRRRTTTRAEALRLLNEMRQEYETNGRVTDRQRLITETMNDYLGSRRAEGLSKSSMDREGRFCDLVASYFGQIKTADLTVEQCDRFLYDVSVGLPGDDDEPTRPLAGRDHLRRLRATMRRAIRNDVRLGLLTTNVADLADLPADTGKRYEMRALSLNELSALLEAADGASQIAIDFIGRHGLRPAEARAMTWRNLNLDRGTLRVTSQIGTDGNFARPKTTRATRTIRLHPGCITTLIGWRSAQLEQRDAAGPCWTELDLVLASAWGTALDRNNLNRSVRHLCGRAGIEPSVSPYELRHTAITHQCESGHHAWQVADWAGTSEKMIYSHYRHLLSDLITLPPVLTEKPNGPG